MKMSIHRALAELKLLENRISRASSETFISTMIGSQGPKGFKSEEEFKTSAESSLKSVKALIARRNAIKSAIVESNAKQVVSIANTEYKVAEAIDRKTSIIFDENLLSNMKRQFKVAMDLFEREQVSFETKLQQHLISMFGTKDSKNQKEDMDAATIAFTKRNKVVLLDPIKLTDEIKKLEKTIEEFKMEVDFVLSESNSSTQIEIPDTN